jgi:hypothetical protein
MFIVKRGTKYLASLKAKVWTPEQPDAQPFRELGKAKKAAELVGGAVVLPSTHATAAHVHGGVRHEPRVFRTPGPPLTMTRSDGAPAAVAAAVAPAGSSTPTRPLVAATGLLALVGRNIDSMPREDLDLLVDLGRKANRRIDELQKVEPGGEPDPVVEDDAAGDAEVDELEREERATAELEHA